MSPLRWYLARVERAEVRYPPRPGVWFGVGALVAVVAVVWVAADVVVGLSNWLAIVAPPVFLMDALICFWRGRRDARRRRACGGPPWWVPEPPLAGHERGRWGNRVAMKR